MIRPWNRSLTNAMGGREVRAVCVSSLQEGARAGRGLGIYISGDENGIGPTCYPGQTTARGFFGSTASQNRRSLVATNFACPFDFESQVVRYQKSMSSAPCPRLPLTHWPGRGRTRRSEPTETGG